jgi:phenylacetic acid degradation operon negative regulatory protein
MAADRTSDGAHAGPGPRRAEQLLLAFFGEVLLDGGLESVPTGVLIRLLGELGIGEVATRTTLARMVSRGLLHKARSGREVTFQVTDTCDRILREARGRVLADDPFVPLGTGWTLVTFSVPESRRDVRHRVRATLTWAGFGLLRDGLWIAPGVVDLPAALATLDGDLDGVDLSAFRAFEIEGFSAARAVRAAWRIDEIRALHVDFLETWGSAEVGNPLRDLTALAADWLALLRADPRLPPEHLTSPWPAAESVRTFHRLHEALLGPAREALQERCRSTGSTGSTGSTAGAPRTTTTTFG